MKRMRMGLHLVALAALAVGFSNGFEESLGSWEHEGVAVVEYIRPGGTCSTPSTDNKASVLHGWKVPSGGLTYHVAIGSLPPGVTAGQFETVVDTAAVAWNSAAGATLLNVNGATVAKDKEGTFNGQSSVQYGGQVPFGAIAVAWVRVSGGVVQEADIRLSKSFKWALNGGITENEASTEDDCAGANGKMDFQDILTHEFGHVVGAAHTNPDTVNNAQTMFPFASYNELFKRTLADGDEISALAVKP